MKNIYIVRKYVQARSIAEALKKEKKVTPADIFLSDHSTAECLEELQPRKSITGFKGKKKE